MHGTVGQVHDCERKRWFSVAILKGKTNTDFNKVYFFHCFVQRHVSALVMSHLQVDYFS
jgi:hypothetical protein